VAILALCFCWVTAFNGLSEALAQVDLLVATPTEVLLAGVAEVGLSGFSIDCVGRVALGTPHALALS
jgi:hypothetical protein